MKYLWDTNVVSAVMRGDERVRTRWKRTAPSDVMVPQPVLAEIAHGIERLPRSKRRTTLRDNFDLLRAGLARADWTDDVSETFASIKTELERRGTPIEDFDVAIAAHAVAYRAILVTSNVAHMARVPGIEVEDWTLPPGK